MKAKELDCVELKNGRKGCLLHEFPNGDFLMEPYESPEIEDQIEISKEDIKRIIGIINNPVVKLQRNCGLAITTLWLAINNPVVKL